MIAFVLSPPLYLNVVHLCRRVQRGLLISLSRRQNGHDGRCGPNGGASLLSMYLGARCGFRISNAFLMLKLKSRLSEY